MQLQRATIFAMSSTGMVLEGKHTSLQVEIYIIKFSQIEWTYEEGFKAKLW